jgi:hypothetical protein
MPPTHTLEQAPVGSHPAVMLMTRKSGGHHMFGVSGSQMMAAAAASHSVHAAAPQCSTGTVHTPTSALPLDSWTACLQGLTQRPRASHNVTGSRA